MVKKGHRIGTYDIVNRIRDDINVRRKVFNQLKSHLVAGFSKDCFEILSSVTIDKLIEEFPNEFIKEEIEAAERKGKHGWESIGRRQAEGTCLGNSRAWYYNMSHRYGWSERQQVDLKHDGQVSVNVVSYSDTSVKV